MGGTEKGIWVGDPDVAGGGTTINAAILKRAFKGYFEEIGIYQTHILRVSLHSRLMLSLYTDFCGCIRPR